MAWKVKVDFVDYYTNKVPRTYTIPEADAPNDGTGYTYAQTSATAIVSAAAAISEANVYLNSIFWQSEGTEYLPATAHCAVRNIIDMSFDLDGKVQKGRISVPCPDPAVVLDSNRQVDLVDVRNTALVQMFLDGELLLSDGDTATWMRDANILSQRGKIETE